MWTILGGIKSLFSLNLYARLGMVALAIFGLWQADRAWQRSIGAKKERAAIITKSNEVANERAGKVSNIRKSIEPSTAWRRLLNDYADNN